MGCSAAGSSALRGLDEGSTCPARQCPQAPCRPVCTPGGDCTATPCCVARPSSPCYCRAPCPARACAVALSCSWRHVESHRRAVAMGAYSNQQKDTRQVRVLLITTRTPRALNAFGLAPSMSVTSRPPIGAFRVHAHSGWRRRSNVCPSFVWHSAPARGCGPMPPPRGRRYSGASGSTHRALASPRGVCVCKAVPEWPWAPPHKKMIEAFQALRRTGIGNVGCHMQQALRLCTRADLLCVRCAPWQDEWQARSPPLAPLCEYCLRLAHAAIPTEPWPLGPLPGTSGRAWCAQVGARHHICARSPK
jgi:hypothetical protein